MDAATAGRAPVVPPAVPHRNRADPQLDADVDRWYDVATRPSLPLVAVLGEPFLRLPGAAPAQWVPRHTEMLVYLAVHPEGVTPDQARADLWRDEGNGSPDAVAEAMHAVRSWVGVDRRTKPATGFVSTVGPDGRYRLRGHLSDWGLLERLRLRARGRAAATHPGALADYRAALKLVRGPLLQPRPAEGYRWLGRNNRRVERLVVRSVVATAHELVDLALASDDPATAQSAAALARRIDRRYAFDQPLTDLMRIAHARSDHGEVERLAAFLLDLRRVEVAEELAPATFRVVDQLLPEGVNRT